MTNNYLSMSRYTDSSHFPPRAGVGRSALIVIGVGILQFFFFLAFALVSPTGAHDRRATLLRHNDPFEDNYR